MFVARHNDKAPLLDDNDDSASRREWGFLTVSRCFDDDVEEEGEN